jgi:hypothetical protein
MSQKYSLDDIEKALYKMRVYQSEADMVIGILKQTVTSINTISICQIIDSLKLISFSNNFTIKLLYELNKEE